ncbi:MAG: LysM peptidoglycan-binding domain-containing protein [Nitrospirae bacterium]|nr:LysM peptidoglycan-binding domain-containing protein [Nitrospirota bacterium]
MKAFFNYLLFVVYFSCLSVLSAPSVYADTTYIVKKGDSLYRISRKFHIPASKIKEANNLTTERLAVGVKLHIPDKSPIYSEQTSRPKPKDAPSTRDKSSATTYTAKNGDNLWGIARKYNMTVDELMKINGLSTKSIRPGKRLIVARGSSSSKDVAAAGVSPSAKSRLIKQADSTKDKIEELAAMSNADDLLSMSANERLLLFAKKMLHFPYKFGGNGLTSVDCSAYVQKAYGFAGLDIPRSAREQFKVGEPITKDDLSSGDMVFFKTYAAFPSHVGIYLGNSLFIHASRKSKMVTIDSLESPYYAKRFIGAKRLLNGDGLISGEIETAEN